MQESWAEASCSLGEIPSGFSRALRSLGAQQKKNIKKIKKKNAL